MAMTNNFENLNLTNDQRNAVEKIESFINRDKQIFILKGYAGTGKTTILKGIASYLAMGAKLATVMAPTGRAAKILKDKTGINATTIHKGIYNFEKLYREEVKEDEKTTYKFFFKLANNEYQPNTVFIVDEASMVGQNYSESEFFRFGSGHLLADLLDFASLHSNKNHKIIFVGDPAQLPPVTDPDSKALSIDFLSSKGYSCEETEMTEVLRQSENSGILNNAMYFRDLLKNNTKNECILNTNFPDIDVLSIPEIAKKYTDLVPVPEISNTSIVVYKNSQAFHYNQMVRNIYFPEKQDIQVGDILMINRNHYNSNIVLYNGDTVKVTKVASEVETQSAKVYINKEPKIIKLQFREIEIFVPSEQENLSIKIIENHLNSKESNLSSPEQKALYVNFVMRFKEKYGARLDVKSTEFQEALRQDPYFNALQVKYAYAITCHKAQGGEWQNVILDFKDRVGLNQNIIRWSYTAITRASNHLFVVNPPCLTPINIVKIGDVVKITKCPAETFNFSNIPTTPYHKENTHPAKRVKYFEIEEKLLSTKYQIDNIVSQEWQETYYLADEISKHRVDIWHNKAGIFSRKECESSEKDALLEIFNAPYNTDYTFTYETNNPVIKKLHQKISELCEQYGAIITNVIDEKLDANSYINIYLKTSAECAYLQCYINKKGQVSNIQPKSLLGNEDAILKKILSNIDK